MRIKKLPDSFNEYRVEMSWGQMETIKNALATDHSDPIADELYAELTWFFQNLPGPGESEDDLKAAEEAGKTGLDQAGPQDQQPLSKADELLPAPGDEEGAGEMPIGDQEGPLPGEEDALGEPGEAGAPEAGEEPPPAPEEENEPVGARRGADDRIPAPPED